jgi:hypothetical protein
VLVATSKPNSTSSPGFWDSTGQPVRLVDVNPRDGVADGPGTVLYGSLPGPLTDLRKVGDLVFVTSVGRRISILRAGASPGDALSFLGSIDFSFPTNWIHQSYALAARSVPGQSATYELNFNVGSDGNSTQRARRRSA